MEEVYMITISHLSLISTGEEDVRLQLLRCVPFPLDVDLVLLAGAAVTRAALARCLNTVPGA